MPRPNLTNSFGSKIMSLKLWLWSSHVSFSEFFTPLAHQTYSNGLIGHLLIYTKTISKRPHSELKLGLVSSFLMTIIVKPFAPMNKVVIYLLYFSFSVHVIYMFD